ncbi:MAG TPA: aminotransferase class III-fold pyridoxal phosphate-dependent enzyme [Solirubrobacterales bacterium]|nr:aminotransferase class III-fold pyridoxal phosphate-dependent enzyme [Solirubrobacterales bacterium]
MPAPKPNRGPVAVSAQGATIRLSDASSLLDFASGGFGHGAAPVAAAVARQMAVNPLATRHFLSLPLGQLTARLAARCPGDLEVSYLCSSQSEAVDGALKLVRGLCPDRHKIVVVRGSNHGSTLGALSVCGRESMRAPLPPLLFEPIIAADANATIGLVDRDTAAVIVEAWPGGHGLPGRDPGWLRALSGRCSESGSLLIADETRSGVGISGAMFGIEHESVVPDLLVLGGGLGGGVLPLAGYVTRRDLNDRVYGRRDPTLHASTTGGNPAACVAGIATLEMVEREGLLERAATRGSQLLSALRELADRQPDSIKEVIGVGLFAQVRLAGPDAGGVAAAARSLGLACEVEAELPGVLLRPPLLVTEEEIERGVEILGDAIGLAVPSGAAR